MPNRPSLDEIFNAQTQRPSLDEIFQKSQPESGMAQLTKGMSELPFMRTLTKDLPIVQEQMSKVPEPKTTGGKVARAIPGVVSDVGAYTTGSLLGGPVGGAAAIGAKEAIKKAEEGGSAGEAMTSGAVSGAVTYVGGKALEGAGKAIMNAPNLLRGVSGRIHDLIVKLPERAFSYSKNPIDVMAKEKITANTIGDYAQKAGERLEQRTQQLNDLASKSTKRLDISNTVNSTIDNAKNELAKSSNEEIKTALTKKLDTLQEWANKKDLTNMSAQDTIDFKRQIAKDYPFSYLEPRTSTGNTLAATAHQIHHGINEVIGKELPALSDLNQRVSGLIDITKAAEHRLHIEARNNPWGLIGSIAGITGAEEGIRKGNIGEGIKSGAEVVILMKVLSSPAGLTRVANTLSRMADVDKINLFNAVPWFKNIAQQAEQKVKSGEIKLPDYSPENFQIDRMAGEGGNLPIKETVKDYDPNGFLAKSKSKMKGNAFAGVGVASVGLSQENKQKIANVENYGKLSGNYAQITQPVIDDLKQLGKLPKNISLSNVKGDSKLYDNVVSAYWNRLGDFGIPENARHLWWYKPALYKQTGGDIEKIKNFKDRVIMRNRVKNQ